MSRFLRVAALVGLQAVVAQQLPFVRVAGSPPLIRIIREDSRGRLWLGTDDGAFVYDGARFFALRDFGLPAGEVLDVTDDSETGLWIASAVGVYRFFGGVVERVMPGHAVSVVRLAPGVIAASVGPAGSAIPRNTDLYRIRRVQRHWQTDKVLNEGTEGQLSVDQHGELLFPCERAWCEVRINDLLNWRSGLAITIGRNYALGFGGQGTTDRAIRDRLGCLWLRTEGWAMRQCPGEEKPVVISTQIAGQSDLAGIWEGPEGSIIFTNNASMSIGRAGAFRTLKPANGLPTVDAAAEGRDGSLWLGGRKGLYRLGPANLEYWTEREGLQQPANALRIGGRTFVGMAEGIAALTADRQRWVQIRSTRPFRLVVNLFRGPDETILAALPYKEIAQLDTNGRLLAQARTRTGGGWIITGRSDGPLWIGGNRLDRVKIDRGRITLETIPLPEPYDNMLDAEYEPHTRTLWACYNGGLVGYDGARWMRITTANGLVQNSCQSLAALPNGDIWYAYNTAKAFALIRRDAHGKFAIRQFPSGGDVGNAETYFLDVDSRGWLWRGGADGTYVADQAMAESGVWLHLGESDGLPALTANQQAFSSDQDGSVWWGAENSLIHFMPPAGFLHPSYAPRVFVSAFSWNGQAPRLVDAIEGVPNGASVTAHIGSLHFDRRNALRLRYRVLPEDKSWRESREMDLALGALPWGGHVLEVQARLLGGPWSASELHRFAILRPIWLSWQMLLVAGAFVLSVGAGGLRWRRKVARRKKRQLPDIAEWRLDALSPDVHALTGAVLDGRFEAGALLARGGFATVLKGVDRAQNLPCAIKVFRREVMDKEWIARRFQHEVSALEQVRHPNVVRIYGHGTTPAGALYLAMEFIDGLTLRELLEQETVPALRVARLLRQAAGALDAIHEQGIYHRDLKPENIMIRNAPDPPGQELALIDFSIAIVKDPDETLHGISRAAGTIHYMAPEQAIGYAEPSSDVYSLAKILIEMLIGRRLSVALPDAALDLPARVRELLATLPFGLSRSTIDMIGAALEFDPSRRPNHAGRFADQVASDLEKLTDRDGP